MKKRIPWIMLMAALSVTFSGCQTQHKVETVHRVEVAPMHITIDVNVKVDRALDDFFDDLDQAEEKIQPKSN
ncbi:MAG: YnbE family lipoprotein [Desulfatitalea sp.]|nr:YnbE family lipoprotein [Desulfatitalea sp.]